jgi:tRNA-2-methylthio-N6-dimethylallyladenosine synthase
MPYLHLPVQSGSDRVLTAMNRGHRAADYLALIDKLRRARPDLALSSDFIVGFPGESEEDFTATLDLAARVDYAQAYSFKYSPRPGTPAALDAEQVPEERKVERLARLQDLLKAQQLRFNRSKVGTRTTVLLEGPGRRARQRIGRTPWLQSVHIEDADWLAGIVEVDIVGAGANSLAGRICPTASTGDRA